MDKSLAMLEYSTVSSGMTAADLLSKTAEIQFIKAKTVCPGKFIVLFCGELAALKNAIEVIKVRYREKLLDSFVLGNPHESIYEVLEICSLDYEIQMKQIDTLGIIEMQTSASAVKAADIAAKAAKIRLLEIRLAKSMCGRAYVLFTGDIASVEESTNAVFAQIDEAALIVDFAVISAPDKKFIDSIGKG